MTSSLKFINLASQNVKKADFRSLGHRTSFVARQIGLLESEKKNKRLSFVDRFKTYTEQVLPRMEESIELRLLRDRYNAIEDPLLKNELLLAYKRRQLNILETKKAREPFRPVSPVEIDFLYEPMDIYVKDIVDLHELDIGKIVEFPKEQLTKYFPLSPLGEYYKDQFSYSQRFCLQCTEDAFKLTNEMRKINYTRLTEKDYTKIFAEAQNSKDIRRILDDEELYPRIFHDIALTLQTKLEPYRKDELMSRLFTECYLFDALVNILVHELVSNTLRPHLINEEKRANVIEQILTQLKEKCDAQANPQRVGETLKPIKNFKITLAAKEGEEKTSKPYLILLKKYAESPRALPAFMRKYGLKNFFGFNSGGIINGVRGAGKSGLLMYAIMWAHKNNWIVVNPPNAYYLTQERQQLVRHHESGLYLEHAKAQLFLRAFKESNYEVIKNIPVNMSLYGKFNSAGVHDEEPEPVPVTYDAERKYWSNDWERFLKEEEKIYMEEEKKIYSVRLKQRLPEPKLLLDIIEHGLKEEMFATNAVFELLEQIYNLDSHRVLVAVDNYNYFFLPTCYPSFRYANQKGYESMIPAHHLALCRAFMKFDGHRIKNGIKLVAPSLKKLYKHHFEPKQINMGTGYTIQLDRLPFDDYLTFTDHLKQANVWREGRALNISATEKKYLESQGNFFETIEGILKPGRVY